MPADHASTLVLDAAAAFRALCIFFFFDIKVTGRWGWDTDRYGMRCCFIHIAISIPMVHDSLNQAAYCIRAGQHREPFLAYG